MKDSCCSDTTGAMLANFTTKSIRMPAKTRKDEEEGLDVAVSFDADSVLAILTHSIPVEFTPDHGLA